MLLVVWLLTNFGNVPASSWEQTVIPGVPTQVRGRGSRR